MQRQKDQREALAKKRGMSLSAYMLLTSEPGELGPSHEDFLRDICLRDQARVELANLAEIISKIPQSPLDAQMVLRRLARIEGLLHNPSGPNGEVES